jgi:hypothetical protein
MKQTAVEWFWIHLEDNISKKYFDLFEQAKEMEKQQMWNYIETNYVIGENSLLFHKQEFEQYYNETFKKENNENKN